MSRPPRAVVPSNVSTPRMTISLPHWATDARFQRERVNARDARFSPPASATGRCDGASTRSIKCDGARNAIRTVSRDGSMHP